MIPVREWRIADMETFEREGQKMRRLRQLTDHEVDYLNANYFALVNQFDKSSFFRETVNAIRQIEVDNMDWWYQQGVFFFTHESERTIVHLMLR